MVPITVYAKSFKEASSILSPMNFLVIVPAIIGMQPGVELSYGTAAIPILNVVLTSKDLIAGTLQAGHFIVVLASLLIYATIAVSISFRRFGNEKNILRS